MPISQRGSTTGSTAANSSSVSVTKPSGTASGDVLVALVTSNDGTISASGGATWTKIGHATGQPDAFDATWFYKVAGGSEPSSYTFTNGGGAAPIAASVMAFTGVDTSGPIGGSLITGSGSSSEPKSVPGCTSAPVALPIWSRSCRVFHNVSDIPSFTATGVTELDDRGVFSTGNVSYGHGIYMGTEASGNPSSLNITESSSSAETDNIVASLTLVTLITDLSVNANAATATTATAYNATGAQGVAAPAGVAAVTAVTATEADAPGVQFSTATAEAYVVDADTQGKPVARHTEVEATAFNIGVHYGAPAGRTMVVGNENRTFLVTRLRVD